MIFCHAGRCIEWPRWFFAKIANHVKGQWWFLLKCASIKKYLVIFSRFQTGGDRFVDILVGIFTNV
jgi:hypothetical protein